jgi:hypothetical protein
MEIAAKCIPGFHVWNKKLGGGMNKRILFLTAILFGFVAQGIFAQQQNQQINTRYGVVTEIVGPQSGTFVAAVFEGKPVKDAPYSAEAINESIQILPDGNRIIKSSSTKLYRDSEGRTRRESSGSNAQPGVFTIKLNGAVPATALPVQVGSVSLQADSGVVDATALAFSTQNRISIHDPILGVNYVMDPKTRTAQKINVWAVSTQDATIAAAVSKAKQDMAAATGQQFVAAEKVNTTVTIIETNKQSASIAQPESLGSRIIEGVECEGTRTSTTIPAGQIGNELPITITAERWYSPKLQADVLVRSYDPRSGENIYKLMGIDQSEPPASLFQVPADYSIVDMAVKPKTIIKK